MDFLPVSLNYLRKGSFFKLSVDSPYIFVRGRKCILSSKFRCYVKKPSFSLFGIKRVFKFSGAVKVFLCSDSGVIYEAEI